MTKCVLLLLMALLLPGCAWINENFYDRLLFVEESHIGLKAKVGIDQTPGDIDFGYRRSMVALIPKANATSDGKRTNFKKPPEQSNDPEKTDCSSNLNDTNELLSVISSFNADVRWFESTRISTYFATGRAAEQTACDLHAIKALLATPND